MKKKGGQIYFYYCGFCLSCNIFSINGTHNYYCVDCGGKIENHIIKQRKTKKEMEATKQRGKYEVYNIGGN